MLFVAFLITDEYNIISRDIYETPWNSDDRNKSNRDFTERLRRKQ
jgi:hypothetical protein